MCDSEFKTELNQLEAEVWKAFVLGVRIFLRNHKAEIYFKWVNSMQVYLQMSCRMYLKISFLNTHLEFWWISKKIPPR